MFCGKCGKKLDDGVKFCPHCGNPVEAQAQPWSPAPYDPSGSPMPYAEPAGPEIPPDNGKKRGFAILAAVGGAAVIAIVAAVVLFGGLFSGPKGDITKAVTKSVNAIHTASQSVGFQDWKGLTDDRKLSQTLSLQVDGISGDLSYYNPELSLLEGLGVNLTEDVNLPDHKLGLSFDVTYGDTGVLSAWMDVDDTVFTLGAPDFLGDRVLGFDSETLGRDLANLGADDAASVSFNLFDIAESLSQTVEVDKSALKDLADAIEVEKTGKSGVDVNGYTLDCTAYRVTIPEEALRTYLGAVEEAYAARGLDDVFLEIYASMGVPADDLDDIREEMQDALSGKAMFDALDEALAGLGGLELDVFIHSGYISAVAWSGETDDGELSLRLSLGGGGNYADDLSFELKLGSDRITISSTGDHSAASGTYTDETSIAISAISSGDRLKITSDTSWDPKTGGFQWSLKTSGVAVTASGRLEVGKDSLSLDLDKLSVNALGTDFVTLSGGYSIRPYAASSHSTKTPDMLADLTGDDLMEIYEDVALNSQEWVLDLGNQIPGLYEYLW